MSEKSKIAGSIQAVKDGAIVYSGSHERGRLSVLDPPQANPDPEVITIDP